MARKPKDDAEICEIRDCHFLVSAAHRIAHASETIDILIAHRNVEAGLRQNGEQVGPYVAMSDKKNLHDTSRPRAQELICFCFALRVACDD
jgi:hypothetical protein